MARTQVTGPQIDDEAIDRDKLDVTTPSEAVISKIIAGTNVTIESTGEDDGTGDVTINFAGGGESGGFADDFSLNIKATDSNDTPTDADAYAIALAQSETNAEQSELVNLGISGAGLNDSNAEPTDARSALLRVWLSGSAGTGVTNPTNANGVNDGTLATLQTAVLGTNPIIMLSALGTNIPAGITFSSAILTVWFRARTTLITSTARIQIEAIAATFTSPVTVFTQSSLAGDTNNLSTPLTFDLVAAGINTLAKLQDMRFRAETIDAVAGVTPAILDVDAATCDIVATSI